MGVRSLKIEPPSVLLVCCAARRASSEDKKKLIDSVDCFIFDCDGEKGGWQGGGGGGVNSPQLQLHLNCMLSCPRHDDCIGAYHVSTPLTHAGCVNLCIHLCTHHSCVLGHCIAS